MSIKQQSCVEAMKAIQMVYANTTKHDWPDDIWDAICKAIEAEPVAGIALQYPQGAVDWQREQQIKAQASITDQKHIHTSDKKEQFDLSKDLVAWQQDAEQGELVGISQVYRCRIKSRKQIDREIPREKQGWWADISAGQLIRLREATQADIDRCTLNGAHSKNPADYMCETHTNGSLVSKAALEYMNPEQRQPHHKPLTDEQFQAIRRSLFRQEGWDGDGWDLALKEAIEVAHGIKENT